MLFTIRKRNPTGSIKNGICWIIIKLTSKAEKESYNLYKHDKYYIRLKDN